jgi:hypothetical protein
MSLGILYLSPMHISERVIMGYELPNTHLEMVDLTKRQRENIGKKSSMIPSWRWQHTYMEQ